MSRASILRGAAALMCVIGTAHAGARELPAASDGKNAWIAVERTSPAGTSHVLLHHAVAMGCDCVREAFVLDRAPEAMAASDGRLWMVMPPGSSGRRDVYSLRSFRNPMTGAHYSDPAGRLEIHPSLPGEDELRGIAIDGDTLLALDGEGKVLLLAGGGWRPSGMDAAGEGTRLAMVAGRAALVDASGRVRVRGADGAWPPAPSLPAVRGFERFVAGAPRPIALASVPGERRRVLLVAPGGAVPIAAIDPAERASAVLGIGDSLAVFAAVGDGSATVQWVDSIDGTLGARVVLADQPGDARAWVCLAAAALGAVAAVAAALLRRSTALKSASSERR